MIAGKALTSLQRLSAEGSDLDEWTLEVWYVHPEAGIQFSFAPASSLRVHEGEMGFGEVAEIRGEDGRIDLIPDREIQRVVIQPPDNV